MLVRAFLAVSWENSGPKAKSRQKVSTAAQFMEVLTGSGTMVM
jgi:hypothetical protein